MSFAFFCIGNLKGLSHIVHFLHSYTASSKVTGSLQCRGQMPIHNNISACWHRPKVIFFFFFFLQYRRESLHSQREGRAASSGKGARLSSVRGALASHNTLSPSSRLLRREHPLLLHSLLPKGPGKATASSSPSQTCTAGPAWSPSFPHPT